jgi:hypothetical protein
MKIIYLSVYNSNEYYDKMLQLQSEYNSSEIFYFVSYKQLNVEYIIDNNIIYINGTESYVPGMLQKTIKAMDIITNKLKIEYDFLIRTSVPTCINFKEVELYLKQLSLKNELYFIGQPNELQWLDPIQGITDTKYFGTKYFEGVFVIYNKKLVQILIKAEFDYSIAEDVSIGYYINNISEVTKIELKEKLCYNNFNFNLNYFAYPNNQNKQDRNIDILNMEFQINELHKKYTIVIPINPKSELNRLYYFFKSLKQYVYLPDVYKVYIITSNEVIEKIKKFNFNFLTFIDEEIIEPLKIPDKWIYQQILKLKISKIIKTKYYLIIDDDMFLIKELCFNDFFDKGHIIYSHESFPHNNPPNYTNKIWWENSCKLLKYPIDKLYNKNNLMSVTPQVMITNLVIELLDNLLKNWEYTYFTEYSLYWIYLIQQDKEHFYTTNGNKLLEQNVLFNLLQFTEYNDSIHIIKNALLEKKYHFLCIQSELNKYGFNINIYLPLIERYLNNSKKEIINDIIDHTLSDKGTLHSYLDLYEKLLYSKKETAKNILEIGVREGGSIKLWADYFLNATVYGIDVDDKLYSIKNNNRIKIFISDAYNENFVNENFVNIKFDMVLDDGPHSLESMKTFIQLYSNLLTDDGILIIEDVQNLEWFDILKEETPHNLKQFIQTYDLRNIKGRYDDLVFTIQKVKINKNYVIYAHYDNIVQDYVIESLNILIKLNYNILFYTSSDDPQQIFNILQQKNIPLTFYSYKNNGAGTDYYMWLDGLKNIKYCDWVMLVNDSLLLGINGIGGMQKTINFMRSKSDLWGHWDSFEINYHYIGTPIEFKGTMVSLFIEFFESKLKLCNYVGDIIDIIETKIIEHFRLIGYKTNCVINCESYKNYLCPSHNPLFLKKWINKPETFAIKWKYVIKYIDLNIFLDKSKAKELGFIDPEIYKKFDLFNVSN